METIQVNTFEEYKQAAMRTCTESSRNKVYMATGLMSEASEVVGKVAKMIRDDNGQLTESRAKEIQAELGDVMWMIAGNIEMYNRKHLLPMRVFNRPDFMEQGANSLYERRPLVYLATTLQFKCSELGRYILDGKMDRYIWYFESIIKIIATLAAKTGSSLKEVCQHNIDKLTDRYNRKQIQGSGDNR